MPGSFLSWITFAPPLLPTGPLPTDPLVFGQGSSCIAAPHPLQQQTQIFCISSKSFAAQVHTEFP